MPWIILGIVFFLILMFIISLYNNLVTVRQRVENSWTQLDVQLKRRYDLISNLVNTVKGYAVHENETLENVIKAKAGAVSAKGLVEQSRAENMLTGALRQLMQVSERYPDLKTDRNFIKLQDELTNTEGKIAFFRQFYNDTVLKLNTIIQKFPNNIFAGMFKFNEAEYFNVDADGIERNEAEADFG